MTDQEFNIFLLLRGDQFFLVGWGTVEKARSKEFIELGFRIRHAIIKLKTLSIKYVDNRERRTLTMTSGGGLDAIGR